MAQHLYSWRDINDFINARIERVYEAVQLNEGVLGIGDWVLIAPDETKWNFIIREVYLNEWSSAQKMTRCRKLSKAIQKEIQAAYDRLDEEENV
jgi:hypothetical protein